MSDLLPGTELSNLLNYIQLSPDNCDCDILPVLRRLPPPPRVAGVGGWTPSPRLTRRCRVQSGVTSWLFGMVPTLVAGPLSLSALCLFYLFIYLFINLRCAAALCRRRRRRRPAVMQRLHCRRQLGGGGEGRGCRRHTVDGSAEQSCAGRVSTPPPPLPLSPAPLPPPPPRTDGRMDNLDIGRGALTS